MPGLAVDSPAKCYAGKMLTLLPGALCAARTISYALLPAQPLPPTTYTVYGTTLCVCTHTHTHTHTHTQHVLHTTTVCAHTHRWPLCSSMTERRLWRVQPVSRLSVFTLHSLHCCRVSVACAIVSASALPHGELHKRADAPIQSTNQESINQPRLFPSDTSSSSSISISSSTATKILGSG